MISITAIIPATKTDINRRSSNKAGPVKVPSAPASFQSPAPKLRSSTKGSNKPRPTSAPNREVFKPLQPLSKVLAATPRANAGTVSQLGIRRVRISVHPAITASNDIPARIFGFTQASIARVPENLRRHHIAREPFPVLSNSAARRERVSRFGPCPPKYRLFGGFSHSEGVKSMNRTERAESI